MSRWCRCFNEAAGIPRGRRGTRPQGRRRPQASMRPRVFPAEDGAAERRAVRGADASMRPRVFPAEDESCRITSRRVAVRFNEAAGIPRGRRTYAPGAPHPSAALQ